ncbi:MAG: hypothetical protein Q9227_003611 [Pyrenula ochraceoflavens]
MASQQYNDRLGHILSSSKTSDPAELTAELCSFTDSILSESLGIVATRPLLGSLIQSLDALPPDVKTTVGQHILQCLQSSTATYDEQEYRLRESLASTYEKEEENATAARVLSAMSLERVPDPSKVQIWIRIVRNYLEADDTVSAETFLNRIKNLPSATSTFSSNPDLKLHYQLSQARILDSRRKFLDASAEYYNVSLSPTVAEDDRLQALSASITAAVLAPAGPQRSRALAKLYKDDRSSGTEEFSILEKMFLDRLLSPGEVDAFAAKLQPHQLAQTADGSTVLAKAVVEHNLLAASKLYETISTDALGLLLGLKDTPGKETAAEKAEDYAARMFEQGRLKGVIDQIQGVIAFEGEGIGVAWERGREVKVWDNGVREIVEMVEQCAAGVVDAFPELTAESMVY